MDPHILSSNLIFWGLKGRGPLHRASLLMGLFLIAGALLWRISSIARRLARPREPRLANHHPLIDETSEESFPASDPPAWNTGR